MYFLQWIFGGEWVPNEDIYTCTGAERFIKPIFSLSNLLFTLIDALLLYLLLSADWLLCFKVGGVLLMLDLITSALSIMQYTAIYHYKKLYQVEGLVDDPIRIRNESVFGDKGCFVQVATLLVYVITVLYFNFR